MPAPKITDEDLLERLTRVFQDHGFEGASLSRISEATGLEKASLYHRFPGGKNQMAEAVLAHVGRWFVENLLAPLRETGPVAARIRETGGESRRSMRTAAAPACSTLYLCATAARRCTRRSAAPTPRGVIRSRLPRGRQDCLPVWLGGEPRRRS